MLFFVFPTLICFPMKVVGHILIIYSWSSLNLEDVPGPTLKGSPFRHHFGNVWLSLFRNESRAVKGKGGYRAQTEPKTFEEF